MTKVRRYFLLFLFCLLLVLASCLSHSIVTPSDSDNTVTPWVATEADIPSTPAEDITREPTGTEIPQTSPPLTSETVTASGSGADHTAAEPKTTEKTHTSTSPAETGAPATTMPSVTKGTPVSTQSPGTTQRPETTGTPSTKVAPETTRTPEITTGAQTTAPSVSTESPVTKVAPETTNAPISTEAPYTTGVPETTLAPISTSSPETTDAPVTTESPDTTQTPVTTDSPETTATPVTTGEPPVTTQPEETEAPLPDFTDPVNYEDDYAYTQLSTYSHSQEMQELYRSLSSSALAFHKNNTNAVNTLLYGTDSLQAKLSSIGVTNPSDFSVAFEVPFSPTLTGEELYIVWYSFKLDHPLYYWIGSMMFYYGNGHHQQFVMLCQARFSDGESRRIFNDTVYSESEVWYRSVLGKNAYAAARSAHDRICSNISYKYDENQQPDTSPPSNSIEGYFTRAGGVCECYSKTFQLWMNLREIPCITVINLNHMWNLLQLDDGNWYWVDVTFDDYPNLYAYFCKNDTEDIWNNSGYLPPSSATNRTFFGSSSHNVLPAGGPDYEYNGQTYAQHFIYFVYALPDRAAQPYNGPK